MSIKGFPTGKGSVQNLFTKLKISIQRFVTISALGSGKSGMDVSPRAWHKLSAIDLAVVSYDSTTGVIEVIGHNARAEDMVRIIGGTANRVETEILAVIDADNILVDKRVIDDVGTITGADSLQVLRAISPLADDQGNANFSPGPLQFIKNASTVTVTEDTVDPNNNIPLPVKLMGITGDINVTAGDLNVQTSHLGPDADSMRIGDGTNLVGVTADNEMLTPPNEYMLDGVKTKVLKDTVTPLDSRGLPIDILEAGVSVVLAKEAKQDTMITSLASIDGKLANLNVVDMLDSVMLDIASTNIPASAAATLEVVAVTAADIKEIEITEDIGEFIGLYVGASTLEVLQTVLPLGGGVRKIHIPAGSRVSLRNMKNAAINTPTFMAINFLG